MASSFIGKPISLISHSDIRYRGTLQGIDPQESTIKLNNVYSMGTETRRPQDQFVPPNPVPYSYIIFKASEVKDLAVDDSIVPPKSIHDDPAVLGASPAVAPNFNTYIQPQQQPAPIHQLQSTTAVSVTPSPATRENIPKPTQPSRQQPPSGHRNRSNPVSSAHAAVEQVERAMIDLRVNGHTNGPINSHRGGRGSGRRGRGGGRVGDDGSDLQIRVPTTDFDFESSNAKFDKTAAKPTGEDNATTDENVGLAEGSRKSAYNPESSFFDSLSTNTIPERGGGRGRRGGGGGGGMSAGRIRRDEERAKNIVTFGETGGIGLLGHGDHVGWSGYGRRGGRLRRGNSRGGAQAAAARG